MTHPFIQFLVIVGLVLVLTSLGIGYQLGTLTSNPPATFGPKESTIKPRKEAEEAEDQNQDEDEDEELEDITDGDLGSISAGFFEPCKLVRLLMTISRIFT